MTEKNVNLAGPYYAFHFRQLIKKLNGNNEKNNETFVLVQTIVHSAITASSSGASFLAWFRMEASAKRE